MLLASFPLPPFLRYKDKVQLALKLAHSLPIALLVSGGALLVLWAGLMLRHRGSTRSGERAPLLIQEF